MKKIAFILLITLLVVGVRAAPGRAAPARQGANLLQNPGFEQPFSGGVAGNWENWSKATPKSDEECLVAYHVLPKWNVETAAGFVRAGTSQYVGNNWDTWSGGVYQTVSATPGTTYRFSFYGRGRGTNEASPAASETNLQMNMRAGIDPNGGTAWNDADVVWSDDGSPHDTWQQFSVEAPATGNQITVFTSADWGVTGVNQCRQFLDTWVDEAQLVAQTPPTQPPPTVPPQPTGGVPTEPAAATLAATLATTAPAASATPGANESPTATPAGSSTICVNAFLDANGNGLRDADEGYVAGVTLTVAQGATIAGQAVSTGGEEPLCFGGLMAGRYEVAQTLPATLETTTQPNAAIDVAEGQTVALEFGSRLQTTPTAPPDTPTADATQLTATAVAAVGTGGEAADAGGSNWLVYLGLGAIVVGVALLGVLLYTMLRR